jgi:hypothetical protein
MNLDLRAEGGDRPAQTFAFLGFVWDVDAALRLAAGRHPTLQLPVAKLRPYLGAMEINEAYALSSATDLARPLLAVRIGGLEGVFVIDGWHRLFKASARRIATLPTVVLNETEERLIRIAGTVSRRSRPRR